MGLCMAVMGVAPLAAGGVHRVPMLVLMAGAAVGIGLVTLALTLQGRVLRVGIGALLPLTLVVLPLVQSVPLPSGVRRHLDPNGSVLLEDNDIALPSLWPMSLDPPSTRVHVGRAAVALAIFIVAYHLASGHRQRHLVVKVIGAAGIVAFTIALGHRVLGFGKLYGVFNSTWRSPLIGPFVNSNHTAEFLELCAFVCLACAFLRPTKLNRAGWLTGTLLCAGGAIATLSRGSVIAFALGIVTFVELRARRGRSPTATGALDRRMKLPLVWGSALLGLVVLGGALVGGAQLVDRFRSVSAGTDVRFQLWRDGLRVLAAHPLGIGRGAFDRVFPVYRTLVTPSPIRFAFLENEPLQLLVDLGWAAFGLLLAAVAVVVTVVVKRGRRDPIEAALAAGLIAVVGHNTVDFGLETLGVLVPFMAVLATLLGRMHAEPEDGAKTRARGWSWGLGAFAGAALVMGIASLAHASSDDFDTLLKNRSPADDRRALLVRAQQTHPIDYFYPLAYARVVPLRGASGAPSPRLHALNRALRLCPGCETVHVEIGRTLWGMGQRRQALLEWRTAIALNPIVLRTAMGELLSAGATAVELASVASPSSARMVDVASFLSDHGQVDDAFAVLEQAEALGGAESACLLLRAALQLRAGRIDAATATIAAAHRAGIADARLALLESRLVLAKSDAAGADSALALLDTAAAREPNNLEVQRARIELVTQYQKWTALSRSIEGFKQALYQAHGSATEAHVVNARIEARLGRWQSALGEYRIALADSPSDVTLWIEFGRQAASIGRTGTAREAYGEAARLSPNNSEITTALRQLDDEQHRLRAIEERGGSLLESGGAGN